MQETNSLACPISIPDSPAEQGAEQQHADQGADLVRALYMLGHSLRFRLISHMMAGPLAVGDLAARTGYSLSVVSQQLALLRKAGLVRGRREVKQVFYSLERARMADVARAIALMAQSGAETSAPSGPNTPIPQE